MKYVILKLQSLNNCSECPVNMICNGNTKKKFINKSEGQSMEEILDLIKTCRSSDYLGIRLVEKDYKIGELFEPFDNSYCKDLSNGNHTLIAQVDPDFPDFDYVGPDKEEDGAQFIVTSEPYQVVVPFLGDEIKHTFINVKSTLTGKEYITLYKPRY